ncbi:hypothetical protein FACS1894184_09150 [Clostridia bacterium]|nr:hypothetical protein FACS1894184_09150 [Clostridia bacterium]
MLEFKDMEDLRSVSRNTSWLWYPFLPAGKLSVLVAEQGEGKTSMALTIASYLSRGIALPGMTNSTDPCNVIFQTAEDEFEETIFQRLEAAGADLRRVSYIVDPNDELTLNSDEFINLIEQKAAKLLIIDPIQGFIGSGYDMNRAVSMRKLLAPLRIAAAKTGCAVLLIAHYNKARGSRRVQNVMGSGDITNISRNVLAISHLDAEPETRFMTHMKSTFAAKGTSITFQLTDKGLVFGEITKLPIEALQEQAKTSQQEKACDIILDMLQDGPAWSRDIVQACIQAKIGTRTIPKAKDEVGAKSKRLDRKWYWYLPEEYNDSE